MNLVPFVIEKGANGERCYDIYSRLLNDRIIFLGDEINQDVATSIVAQLLLLSQQSTDEDIRFYIMSPGGDASAALAIYDTMQNIPCPVSTYCIGMAMSAAALLLCAGTKGKRYSLPSSRIMIHQPSGVAEGQASDVSIEADEIKVIQKYYYDRMSKHTGQRVKQVEEDCDRNCYMSADEAKKYGLVDYVLRTGLPVPGRKRKSPEVYGIP